MENVRRNCESRKVASSYLHINRKIWRRQSFQITTSIKMELHKVFSTNQWVVWIYFPQNRKRKEKKFDFPFNGKWNGKAQSISWLKVREIMYFSSRFPRETGFPLVSGSNLVKRCFLEFWRIRCAVCVLAGPLGVSPYTDTNMPGWCQHQYPPS